MTLVVVVDTNVLVSGLITNEVDAPTAVIVDRMLAGELPFLLSDALIAEYRQVLLRPKIASAHGLSAAEIDTLLTDLIANAIMPEVPPLAAAAPDPGDNHVWALAAAHRGAVVVTGDQVLLEKPPRGVSVVTPRALLDLPKAG